MERIEQPHMLCRDVLLLQIQRQAGSSRGDRDARAASPEAIAAADPSNSSAVIVRSTFGENEQTMSVLPSFSVLWKRRQQQRSWTQRLLPVAFSSALVSPLLLLLLCCLPPVSASNRISSTCP